MQRVWLLTVAIVTLVSLRVPGAEKCELRDGDRIVFLGDTVFEREGEYGRLEAAITASFADRRLTFRNLSWAADTPMGRSRASFDWNKPESEWLKRVKEQVSLVKPTVAFLSYGATAALENGEAGIARYKGDLGRLMEAVEEISAEKVRWVVFGPVPMNPKLAGGASLPGLAGLIEKYDDASRDVATERHAAFVSYRQAIPADALRADGLFDGTLPTDRMYESLLAEPALQAFDGRQDRWWSAADSQTGFSILRQAVQEKNAQFFHRWRPANWTYLFGFRKHEQGRNAVEIPRFDPIVEEWDQRIARLRDGQQQDPAAVSAVRTLVEARQARSTRARPGADGAGAPGKSTGGQPDPTFTVHDGFEVTLWAENPLLFKPIQMNWDPQGRLWVASSKVYPMIQPGQEAEDSVIVLEDADGDGVAEKSTVFADGLVIPTSVVPDGAGGCYVGASHQLLHFDAEGRKRIVMSSFGTEDTHHNLHTLRWGYDGHLYMSQSIYTHTHIETPFGVRRLNSAGIWRYTPETGQMEIFTKGGCNPWGHHWDQYGNHFFTDGAGFKGVYHAMEGATYFTYSDMRREAESISPGNYPKFCSLELVHSPAFPDDWQGQVITCDFRAHRVVRFGLKDVGSTFQTVELPDLARSTNVTFRPIDVRFGPDGALYIADWSNPIIQHGEVDFRDPRRDKEHGRIWRVAARGRTKPARATDLARLGTQDLLGLTLSKSGWEQEQARLVLRTRGAEATLPEARNWLARQTDPRARLEVLWLHEAFERKSPGLVEDLAMAGDPRLRTAAARELARE